MAHTLPGYLIERFQRWHSERFQPNRAWYGRLATNGQRPRAMVVSCCDSRLDVVQMFGAEPGDLFVVRNVANLVPPYKPDHQHHGTSAAVEYAVGGLGVAHIVVVGHSDCGGVAACAKMCSGEAPELDETSSFIGRWMDILRPGYAKISHEKDPKVRATALEHEAVRTSLANLQSFPFVQKAVREGLLTLHGTWVDIGTGQLHVMGQNGKFSPA